MLAKDPFQTIPGNFHVKRAVEVAVAGQHCIAIFGVSDSPLAWFYRAANALYTAVWGEVGFWKCVTWDIGYLGHPTKLDERPLEAVQQMRHKFDMQRREHGIVLAVGATIPRPYEIERLEEGELSSEIVRRVKERLLQLQMSLTVQPAIDELPENARRLCRQAQDRFSFSWDDLLGILRVAQTVSILDDAKDIRIEHLSEALQYAAGWHDLIWGSY